MSTAEKPHPIVAHLESIENRLSGIEKALGIGEKPKPVLRTRTIVLIVVLLILGGGFYFAINYVFNTLFDALPI